MSRPDGALASGLSHGAIRAQLERILQSPTFSSAPTLCRLLKHSVECTLRGTAGHLKEYAIGVEVFGRGESFDPKSDTIVRVQARRLRAKLAEYYRGDGQWDAVTIEIPAGRYSAVFTARSTSLPAARASAVIFRERVPRPVAALAEVSRPPLPVPLTRLIGRDRELGELGRLLRDPAVRLVTLTGPGGCGKTRLALEAARGVTDVYPAGVLMLSLAPLAGPVAVATALAQVMGLRHTAGRPLREALPSHVAQVVTAPMLLVLDNFEHVLAAAPAVADLLRASEHVRVLVTSRAVLDVYGEREYPLSPLEVPDPTRDLASLEQNAAIRLFVERAHAADPAFALTAANAPAVTTICRRLDGLPLAIELAAARIRVFPPDAMLARLDRPLEFLTGGPRDAPGRHRTLRSTMAWSHELLAEPERRLFRRLGVLVGGCTLEGAEAVCNAYRDLNVDVVGGMASLVDKSLVQPAGSFAGEPRFNMLETVREYALELLAASGEETATRRAHAAYCMVLAEEGAIQVTRAQSEAWLSRCDVEVDNFRAALDFLVGSRHAAWALQLGIALFAYWERRELLEEGRHRLQAVVDLGADAPPTPAWALAAGYTAAMCDLLGDRATARRLHERSLDAFRALGDKKGEAAQLNSLAVQHHFMGQYAAARPYLERTVQLCRELGREEEIAAALSNLAGAVSGDGDHATARQLLEEARSMFERVGDSGGVMWSLNRMGDVARRRGDLAEAQRLYTAALDGFTNLSEPWGMARSATDLARVCVEMGDSVRGRALLRQGLEIFAEIDHKRGIARVLEGFAVLADHEGDFDRAITLAGAAEAIRQAFGAAQREVDQADLDGSLSGAWRDRSAAEGRAFWDAGGRMTLDEAIRFALG